MYESPIEKIYGELQTRMIQDDENLLMEAVRNVSVSVDKDELIKALQYDRNQYNKGYKDGTNDTLNEIRIEIGRINDTMGVSYNKYISMSDVLNIIDSISRK